MKTQIKKRNRRYYRLSQRQNGYRDMQVTDVKFLEAFVTVPDTEAADEIFGKSTE